MKKKPFVTLEKLQEITEKYPTPFHLYDEKGIRENAKALKEAFAWNKGFKEFFAVKATPNPYLIQILQEYGCGCDCSSMTELMLSKAIGCKKGDIMFSSNDTPEAEFRYANEIGGIINLDDITHIKAVEKAVGYIPKTISCRYNPGGVFKISNDIMDNPGDAKYGMTTEQIFEAFRTLKAKGAENFGIRQTNSIGVIDETYCGDNDQWYFPARADRHTVIHVGDRICQFRIEKHQPQLFFEPVDTLGNADRGGIGSTGKR